jgi:hypothetical protein
VPNIKSGTIEYYLPSVAGERTYSVFVNFPDYL